MKSRMLGWPLSFLVQMRKSWLNDIYILVITMKKKELVTRILSLGSFTEVFLGPPSQVHLLMLAFYVHL